MNHLDIERLVRRVLGVLRGSVEVSLAPKLAADYVAVCRAIALRLQQCEAMIRARDFAQAVQLAETTPNLLDCITLLEFREADEWRDYCRTNRLPVAEPFDPKAVRLLNECYAQGIKADDPLYQRYRKAVLTKDDAEALNVLKSIVRINPGDANAATEISRLDRKVLSDRLEKLRAAIAAGQTAPAMELINQIETFGFQSSPVGEVWTQAQQARAVELLGAAEFDRHQGRWREVLLALEFINSLQTDFNFSLPPESAARLAALESWARGEENQDRKERQFNSLQAELHYRVEQSEQNDLAAREVALNELRGDSEALQKVWRALEEFARPIPEEIATRYRKRVKLLQMEIQRRTNRRLKLIAVSTLAGLVLGGWLLWFFLGQARARDFAKQLTQAVAARQAVTAEKLLKSVQESDARLLHYGSMSSAAASAESFLETEHAKLKTFEAALAQLPREFPAQPAGEKLAAIQQLFSDATNQLAQIAGDLKAAEEPQVLAFQNKWEAYLSGQTTAVNLGFERAVQQAEQLAARLDYTQALEPIRERLAEFASRQSKLADYETGFKGVVKVREDLLNRSGAAQARAAAYREELEKLDRGLAQLRAAKSFEEFANALKTLARSQFTSAPETREAGVVEGLGIAPDGALTALLFPNHFKVVAQLRGASATTLTPEAVMPAERDLYLKLLNDEAVSGPHFNYRLVLNRQKNTGLTWLTAMAIKKQPGWSTIGVYQPEQSPDHYTAQATDYGFFDDKYQLTPQQGIEEIQDRGPATETAVFTQAKVDQLITANREAYRFPLVKALEEIKNSPEGSPLFRAYLSLRLMELMELEPELWGLPFAPALQDFRAALRKAGAGEIASGDWFAPNRVQKFHGTLEKSFAAFRPVSFWDQAQGLARLSKLAVDSGLTYAGFVGLDGQPQLLAGQPYGELIGCGANDKAPAVLFQATQQHWISSRAPLPFSPLFTLAKSRAELLARAGIDLKNKTFAGQLPPLFADFKETQ